jgi:hypothetical protein
MSNNDVKFHMMGRDLLYSILLIFDLSVFQFMLLTFDEHDVAGLEFLE